MPLFALFDTNYWSYSYRASTLNNQQHHNVSLESEFTSQGRRAATSSSEVQLCDNILQYTSTERQ